MASNVVIDSTKLSSLNSDVASIKQYLNKGQYYYKGRDSAASSVYPYLPSGLTQAMSIFQTVIPITITSAQQALDLVVPPNAFKNTPIVSATVECAAAKGPMTVILTKIDQGSNGMSFDVWTTGITTFPKGGIPAFVHITAISYE